MCYLTLDFVETGGELYNHIHSQHDAKLLIIKVKFAVCFI